MCFELDFFVGKDVRGVVGKVWVVIIFYFGIREKKYYLESVFWLGAVVYIGNVYIWEGEVGREGCFKLKVSLVYDVRFCRRKERRKERGKENLFF